MTNYVVISGGDFWAEWFSWLKENVGEVEEDWDWNFHSEYQIGFTFKKSKDASWFLLRWS